MNDFFSFCFARVSPLLLFLPLLCFSHAATGDEKSVAPFECPQCGTWKITSAQTFPIEDDSIVISKDRISIPLCGFFSYRTLEKEIIPLKQEHDRDYPEYKLLLDIDTAHDDDFSLCPKIGQYEQRHLRLRAEIEGGFGHGNRAEFDLLIVDGEKSTSLQHFWAWNMERGNPCDTGSALGSWHCAMSSAASYFKALSWYLNKNHQTTFNPVRFYHAVEEFCVGETADMGLGSWPRAWKWVCISRKLREKIHETSLWERCQADKENGEDVCPFPQETFSQCFCVTVECREECEGSSQ